MIKGEPIYNKQCALKRLMIIALLLSAVAVYPGNTSFFKKQHNRIELVGTSNTKAATKAFCYKQPFSVECKKQLYYTVTKLWAFVLLQHNSVSTVQFNTIAIQAFSITTPCRFRQLKTIPQGNCDSFFISAKG
jgi:hypothetical protein